MLELIRSKKSLICLGASFMLGLVAYAAQDGKEWEVHDPSRPQPKIVTPATFSTQEQAGKAPSDAMVLFDGTDLSQWRGDKGTAEWKVENGYMEVAKGKGTITTKESFGDCQLHIEWMAPNPPKGSSQGRGNSGIFLMSRYELQVLDCYNNPSYADGMAGSVYGQYPPLVNACREPGQWQMYDVVFRRPRFDGDGKVVEPARITVFLNGVVVQDSTEIRGPTAHKAVAKYSPHPDRAPIQLQDHGDPVRFRNIWIRPLPEVKPTPATVPPTNHE